MRYLITLLFFFSVHSFSLAAPIKDFTARYDIYHSETYIGQTTRRLTNKNNTLNFSSISKTEGIAAWFVDVTIAETSKLNYKNNQLSFSSYSYDEKKNDTTKKYKLSTDKANKLHNSNTNKYYPIVNNLHDPLGFTMAIMQDMQNGKRELKYTIAGKSKIKKYTLKFIEKENIPSNGGHLTSFKMEHYNPKTKERFTLWCVEDLGFLPVRIHSINRKGNETLLNLTLFNQKIYNLELSEQDSE